MASAYLIAACRTPIGRFLGSLAGASAPRLAAAAIAGALRQADIPPGIVDEVVLGHVLSAGVGQAPARQAALAAGLSPTIASFAVNKVCGSGLKAVMLADQIIRAGDARVIVAGGMENMSQAPYLLSGVRSGWKSGEQRAIDGMFHDGLFCALERRGMGDLADYTARTHGVTRVDQDAFAAESHRRAIAAREESLLEMVPVDVAQGETTARVERDEGPRTDATPERLARLQPAFSAEGTVTAGNASQLSDGAAAVVAVDQEIADSSHGQLKARIVASATSGVSPKELFIAPVNAIQKALAKARLKLSDIDLVELNEAFAAQAVSCARLLDLHPDKLNVAGGAIALGHPIGASGARILVTLLHQLIARGGRLGLASLCLGGGNAVAMIVERVE